MLRRLAVFSSCGFARGLPARGDFFFELNRIPLFVAGVDFAFARAGAFRFPVGFVPAFVEIFLDVVFLGRAGLFFFFFFMLALRVLFLAMVVYVPWAATIRENARKLKKRPPAGKRAWGEDRVCH